MMSTGQLGLEGVAVTPEGGDFVSTPPAVTRVLLGCCPPPRRARIGDPFAGGGAILQVLAEERYPGDFLAVEIRPEERPHLERCAGAVCIGDWTGEAAAEQAEAHRGRGRVARQLARPGGDRGDDPRGAECLWAGGGAVTILRDSDGNPAAPNHEEE